MEDQEIQEQINILEGENAAMLVKVYAVGTVGAVAGLILANKQGRGIWGKIGYFIAGGMVARVPMVLIFSKKLAENNAKIENLKLQLE